MTTAAPLVWAVDGGGSKTDVAVLRPDGSVIARAVGAAAVPQVVGVAASLAAVLELGGDACRTAQVDPRRLTSPAAAVFHLAGIDLHAEQAAYVAAARRRITGPLVVDNDAIAVLRAGIPHGPGVAISCGTGANCVAVAPDGTVARYRALGAISGDRAGGRLLGRDALFHAARSEDGRGPHTALQALVPQRLGLPGAGAVAEALHLGGLPPEALDTLAPVVMAAAAAGDPVAGRLLDDLADELVTMATALIHRLGLDDHGLAITLGGGVLQAADTRLLTRLTDGLRATATAATVTVLDRPPIAGSAAVALELAGAPAGARDALAATDWTTVPAPRR